MNNLAYKLLVDKSIKRKVDIIQLLSESTDPISVETIRLHCDVTKRTIQKEINYLLTNYPRIFELVQYNHQESLNKKVAVTELHLLIDSFVSGSPLFFVVEELYEGKSELITYYSDELYISESTIRKHFRILRSVLQEYNLDLNLNPIEIIGNEIDIRFFFFHYFRFAHKSSALYYREDQLSFIYQTIRKLVDTHGFVLNVDYYRVASWLVIFEKRISQGHTVNFEESFHEHFNHKTSYKKFKSAVKVFFSRGELFSDLSDHELLFAFITRLDTVIYETNKIFLPDDYWNELSEFDSLIKDFFELQGLTISLNGQLKITLQSFLVNLSILSQLNPNFQRNSGQLKEIVNTNHLTTLEVWIELLTMHTNFEHVYDIAVSLTILTESKVRVKRNVLFALTGEPITIPYYKAQAIKCVPKDMESHFLFNQPLDSQTLEKLEIDICIYNVPINDKFNDCYKIKFSDIPSTTEWDELQTYLHTL